jgi:opacity protein-like surface antigen
MKKIMLVAVMATLSLGAFAQGNGNWFASVGGGVNIYSDAAITDGPRSSFALDLSAGKWFTPASGARLQYAGVSAKGWGGHTSDKLGFSAVHADYLWNISNTIGGEKDRLWSFVPFAGIGMAFGGGNSSFGFAGGLLNQIRVSDCLDVNLEMRGIRTTKRFDGVTVESGFRARTVASVTVGIGYNF